MHAIIPVTRCSFLHYGPKVFCGALQLDITTCTRLMSNIGSAFQQRFCANTDANSYQFQRRAKATAFCVLMIFCFKLSSLNLIVHAGSTQHRAELASKTSSLRDLNCFFPRISKESLSHRVVFPFAVSAAVVVCRTKSIDLAASLNYRLLRLKQKPKTCKNCKKQTS